ncbi:F-box/FBD/LRR-repeat protein At2g26030-like [Chenopodium quinoa]|uniref:F-box domain-containing protein n=1 Tax=Chenopodium quinoa TaxID=63459 RepID=A0A803LYY4_CHEQI|nr:F-box/FBD/LRR-repeat protein At2g26030-like [Chenopodium quinoa]
MKLHEIDPTTSNNGRRLRRRLNNEEQDRLSSLPDSILTDILSHLPTNSAATTSVLSHRWRHLWTTVTCFQFDFDLSEQTSSNILLIVNNILQQMIAPKLYGFHLVFPSESNLDQPDAAEQCFRTIFRRKVEQIVFNAGFRSFFRVPAACLFDSQSLVSLKLIGMLKIELPENIEIRLPNLKKLSLCYLLDVPIMLRNMFEFCPLLEDVQLSFDLISLPQPQNPHSLVNVFSPNLKSLDICMNSWCHLKRSRIFIDAPKLANIRVSDCYSFYSFVQYPTALASACIDLKGNSIVESNDFELQDEEDLYVNGMFEFLERMSSVDNLELMVGKRTNIFTRLGVDMPIFNNLVRLKANCFKDLMRCLHNFPKLEHLEVSLCSEDYDVPTEQRDWYAPYSVPDCLVSKLKTVRIEGLKGIDDDLKLLEYILRNAMVLEKLCTTIRFKVEHRMRSNVLKESHFYKSLYNLPRSSSTCEVVVPKRVTASSDVFKNGYATSCCPNTNI